VVVRRCSRGEKGGGGGGGGGGVGGVGLGGHSLDKPRTQLADSTCCVPESKRPRELTHADFSKRFGSG